MNLKLSSFGTMRRSHGFTLAELAVVLVIVVLLLGGLLVPLSAQIEARNITETQRTLSDIREALLGFSAAQGRLPCPAKSVTAADTGIESPDGGGACTNPYDGFVPGITLGITPTDSAGYVVDAWGQRIRFAVSRDPTGGTLSSNATSPPRWSFTTTNGMHSLATLPGNTIGSLHPDLQICASGGASAQQICSGTTLSNGAVAIVYSLGKNGRTGGTGSDESNNPNPNFAYANDRVFLSHEPTGAASAGGEFDDIVTWLSPNVLYNRMIAAGRLP